MTGACFLPFMSLFSALSSRLKNDDHHFGGNFPRRVDFSDYNKTMSKLYILYESHSSWMSVSSWSPRFLALCRA